MKYISLIFLLSIAFTSLLAEEKWVMGASQSGVNYKVLEAIAEGMGVEYQFNHYAFSERLALMKTGEIDIVAGLLRTPEREQFIHFIEPAIKEANDRIFYVLKGNKSRISKYEDLHGLRIGTTHDVRYFERFDNDSTLVKRPENSVVINFLKLIRGEIDTLVIPENSQYRAIRELGINDLVEIADYRFDNKTPIYIGISRQSPLMGQIQAIESLVATLKAQNTFAEIERNYYSTIVEPSILFTLDEQHYLNNKDTLTVCVNRDRMPLEALSDNGTYQGVAVDLMTLIAKKINKPIAIISHDNWSGTMSDFIDNKCDVIPAVINTPSLHPDMILTSSYLSKTLVVATHEDEFFIENSSDLIGKRVTVPEGSIADILTIKQPEIDILRVHNAVEGIDKLIDRNIYGYVDILPVVAYTLQQEGYLDFKVAGKLEIDVSFSMALHRDDEHLRSIIEKAMAEIGQGQLAAIENKWFTVNYVQAIDYRQLLYVSLFFIILLIIYSYKNKAIKKINLQLIQANEKVQSQVESLIEARERAEKSEQLKIQFIANMSHEIRTPMNGIIGFLQVLEEANLPGKHKKKINAIKQSSQQLLSIVNDILDLSKLEQDGITLVEEPFSVKEMLNNIFTIFQPAFEDKSIKFTIHYAKSFPDFFMGDELRLRQIISNLTSNALKFTQQGEVSIHAIYHYETTELEIIVSDTGIGIKSEFLDQLFTPFTQEDGHIARKYGGTGLGLNISQKLLDLMDGEITVISTSGKGSVFKVTIPLNQTDNKPVHSDNDVHADINDIPACTILIAEDNRTNQLVLKAMLKSPRVRLEFANDGNEALKIASDKAFDLILMDIQMPVMDGLTATKVLREEYNYSKPIIGVSANAMKEDIDKAKAAGMDDYLAKPVIKNALYQLLIKWLSQP